MSRYRLFDFTIESDVELRELDHADEGAAPALRLVRDVHPEEAASARPFRSLSADTEQWAQIARAHDGFVFRFGERLMLRYAPPEVRWTAAPELDGSTFRHIVLDQALPLIVAQMGRLVLHAACVWSGETARLLVGPAGAGKSTLAASLARDAGVSVGDDAVAVDLRRSGIVARPAYGGLRLWPDSVAATGYGADGAEVSGRSDKRRFAARRPALADLRVSAVHVVESAAAGAMPAVVRISRREAFMSLLRNSYVLDVADRARAVAHLDDLAALAAGIPMYRLVVPRRFDALSTVGHLLAAVEAADEAAS